MFYLRLYCQLSLLNSSFKPCVNT